MEPVAGGGLGGLAARAGALLAAGALLGLALNVVHPRGVRFGSHAAPSACLQPTSTPGEPTPTPVELLTLSQVASLCGDPRVLVADARAADQFAEGHVAGAIHLPCASSRMAASAALDLLAGKETLVVYGAGTEDALPVAEEMRRRGSQPGARPAARVAVLQGGFTAWSRAGLACSSGPCADCGAGHR
jgi:rhodanese-related sulfurtransferase